MNITKAQREQVKQKFGCRCSYCGTPLGSKWHVDHLEPVLRDFEWVKHPEKGYMVTRQTGQLLRPENDNFENLMPACVRCNLNKSSMSLEGWRSVLKGYISSLNKHGKYAMYQHAKRFGLLVEVEGSPEHLEFWFERYLRGEQYIVAPQVITWHKFKDKEPEIDQKILVSFSNGDYNGSLECTYEGKFFVRNEPWHSTVSNDDMWCSMPKPKLE